MSGTVFTQQQKLQLAVACTILDEGMVMLTAPQVDCTENEARAVLEELIKRIHDSLENNKDFTPLEVNNHDALVEALRRIVKEPFKYCLTLQERDALNNARAVLRGLE